MGIKEVRHDIQRKRQQFSDARERWGKKIDERRGSYQLAGEQIIVRLLGESRSRFTENCTTEGYGLLPKGTRVNIVLEVINQTDNPNTLIAIRPVFINRVRLSRDQFVEPDILFGEFRACSPGQDEAINDVRTAKINQLQHLQSTATQTDTLKDPFKERELELKVAGKKLIAEASKAALLQDLVEKIPQKKLPYDSNVIIGVKIIRVGHIWPHRSEEWPEDYRKVLAFRRETHEARRVAS